MPTTSGQVFRSGVTYEWSVAGGLITINGLDGETMRRRLGGSGPKEVAKLLARQIECERNGGKPNDPRKNPSISAGAQ